MIPFSRRLSFGFALVAFALAAPLRAADTPDVNAANEQAMKAGDPRLQPASAAHGDEGTLRPVLEHAVGAKH